MKGLLNETGDLSVNKIIQYCPFNTRVRSCGQWCPLFGEPIEVPLIHEKDSFRTLLQICQSRTLSFTELIDMRE